MKRIPLLFLAFILICISSFGQTLKEPTEGKSLIYFIRSGIMGFAVSFKYFDGDKYIGSLKGEQLFVYECDPGKHRIWANSENFSFIDADLEEGRIYIINTKAKMGGMKANVKLIPLDKNQKKFEKHKKKLLYHLVQCQEVSFNNEKLLKGQEINKKIIAKGTRYFENLIKYKMDYLIISPDMFYPVEVSNK